MKNAKNYNTMTIIYATQYDDMMTMTCQVYHQGALGDWKRAGFASIVVEAEHLIVVWLVLIGLVFGLFGWFVLVW